MKKYLFAIPVIFLVFSGCSTLAETGEVGHKKSGGTASVKTESIIDGDAALPSGFLPGNSITTQLFTAYGEPRNIIEETRENIQAPDYTDTIRTYHYKNFSYCILESGYSGDEILLETTINGKGIELNNHLEIGLDRSKVYELLGFPSMEDDISMIFYLQEDENSTAYEYYLKMENDKVVMIVITGYIF